MRARLLLPALALTTALAVVAAAAPGDNGRVSVDDAEQPATTPAVGAAVSADGRFVLFTSRSPLAGVPTNDVLQLYVRDRRTGTTRLVSSNAAGAAATADVDEDEMNMPYAISADGRYATFASVATNLIANDTNAAEKDVFRKDLQTGEVIAVSVNDAGQQANVGVQGNPDISGDGSKVVFITGAATTNLFPNDTNNAMDTVVRDVAANRTILASQSTAGVLAENFTERPAISANGRFVVFEAFMGTTNLVPEDDNAQSDIFIRDIVGNATTRVSLATDGTDPGGTNSPDVSGDGRYVIWQSPSKFDPVNDGNAAQDVYRRDMVLATTVLVSAANGGDAAGDGDSRVASINADGSRVAFLSSATTLLGPGNDANAVDDVFVRDIPAKLTTRASSPTAPAPNASTGGTIAGNGAIVTVNYDDNAAKPYLAGDDNLVRDVFTREYAPTDATAPTVSISAPPLGAITTEAQVTVTGVVSDPSGIASLTVGGTRVAPAANGTFSQVVPATLGPNTVPVVALDGAGNAVTVNRVVARANPVTPPPVRVRPGRITIVPGPLRDRTAPFRYVVSGRINLPAGTTAADACKGGVQVRVFRGTSNRRIKVVRTAIRNDAGRCRYRGIVQFPTQASVGRRTTRIRVRTVFAGNRSLLQHSSAFVTLRVG